MFEGLAGRPDGAGRQSGRGNLLAVIRPTHSYLRCWCCDLCRGLFRPTPFTPGSRPALIAVWPWRPPAGHALLFGIGDSNQ